MDSSWHQARHAHNVSDSWHSHNTYRSAQTQSTAATEYSYRPMSSGFPKEEGTSLAPGHYPEQQQYAQHEQRSSSLTCDLRDSFDQESDADSDAEDEYEVLPPPESQYGSDATASTPRSFAQHFPSDNRIFIRHDDSTLDGNMNLRLDALVPNKHGQRSPLTLFHLRMHDLRSRDFSLRRYCRDSGREVCRSARVYEEAPSSQQKPSLQKSLSFVLASLKRQNSSETKPMNRRRADSGVSASWDGDDCYEPPSPRKRSRRIATNTINLEFSNYAHVDIKRQGRGAKKCYNFEYWGVKYSWRRHVKQDGDFITVSYHLFKNGERLPSAHIVPDALTRYQALEEQQKGGFIPQSSLWIKDQDILTSLPDVADVVLTTGIIALVDDTIKTTWPQRRSKSFTIPLFNTPSTASNAQQSNKNAAKQLIDTVFGRPQPSHRRYTSTATTPFGSNRRRLTQ